MAEGTYEYECERAELLGIEKPDYEDFMKNKKNEVQQEEEEIEELKEVENQGEGFKNISGGLDELNNILQVTQRKLNRFKTSCGSFTTFLKFKIGGGAEASTSTVVNSEHHQEVPQEVVNSTNGTPRKSDLAKALDNHVDRLDSMLEKAENAQYSMQHQNKQMKKFLNN